MVLRAFGVVRFCREGLILGSLLLCAAGCTPEMVGALTGHKPGGTVSAVSQSASHITLAYTHSYAEELPYTSQVATNWCRQNSGRRAVLVQNQRNSLDRSTVTYSCVD